MLNCDTKKKYDKNEKQTHKKNVTKFYRKRVMKIYKNVWKLTCICQFATRMPLKVENWEAKREARTSPWNY